MANQTDVLASVMHALKWAAECISLDTGDGAGWTGVQQGFDRERLISEDRGFDREGVRSLLERVVHHEFIQGGK